MSETTDNVAKSELGGGPTAISHDLFCTGCGYNLRGITGDRCPECGHDLTALRSPVSQIPWVRRREIGRFRDYWLTAWMDCARNRRFFEEHARPVKF